MKAGGPWRPPGVIRKQREGRNLYKEEDIRKSNVADPVQFFSDLDPDPTGICFFFLLSKNYFFLWHFLTEFKHLLILIIKDEKVF